MKRYTVHIDRYNRAGALWVHNIKYILIVHVKSSFSLVSASRDWRYHPPKLQPRGGTNNPRLHATVGRQGGSFRNQRGPPKVSGGTFRVHGGPSKVSGGTFRVHGGPSKVSGGPFRIHGGPLGIEGDVPGLYGRNGSFPCLRISRYGLKSVSPKPKVGSWFSIFFYRWISIYNTTPLLILFFHPLSYFFSWSNHMCRSQLQHGAVCPLDFLPFNCFNTFECRAANLRVHKNHSFHTYNTTYVSLLTNCKSVWMY